MKNQSFPAIALMMIAWVIIAVVTGAIILIIKLATKQLPAPAVPDYSPIFESSREPDPEPVPQPRSKSKKRTIANLIKEEVGAA